MSTADVVIVDYGMGNVGSIANMLRKIGVSATISGDPQVIRTAGRLILPGVGAFDRGMANLESLGLRAPLDDAVCERGTPILGICLGMQLLGRRSEEGERPGLGWVAAESVRFRFPAGAEELKVPHMGWAEVNITRTDTIFRGWQGEARFYFVHSYHVVCDDVADVTARSTYGIPFTAALSSGNVHGVQFHPEKSHRYGMRLLAAFAGKAAP